MGTFKYRPSFGLLNTLKSTYDIEYAYGFLRQNGMTAMASDELVVAIDDEVENGRGFGDQEVSITLADSEWIPEHWNTEIEDGTVFLSNPV